MGVAAWSHLLGLNCRTTLKLKYVVLGLSLKTSPKDSFISAQRGWKSTLIWHGRLWWICQFVGCEGEEEENRQGAGGAPPQGKRKRLFSSFGFVCWKLNRLTFAFC